MTSVLWLRRDLRRADHPAGAQAARHGPAVACFVWDPALMATRGPVRSGWLAASLLALREELDGRLCLRLGDAPDAIPALAAQLGAGSVHVSAETEPAASNQDAAVREQLAAAGITWVETGSPYAVAPATLGGATGRGYSVFSAFHRAWLNHGWEAPSAELPARDLREAPSDAGAWELLRAAVRDCPVPLPPAGERAAAERWSQFREHGLARYADERDRPDLDGTSGLSAHLAVGAIHPRTLLADLTEHSGEGPERFVAEVAWREFAAELLVREPTLLASDLKVLPLVYDRPGHRFAAWADGRTGYPIVDAGQRQLLATGWMPNRVRMISASFLVKDLHVWWAHGAAHFAQHLLDADLASNALNWQWVAGTGTDTAPYFRVFNPTVQAERFDPSGAYVHRWVPELRQLSGARVHRPWAAAAGYDHGYPRPIIDHDTERREALARYQVARRR